MRRYKVMLPLRVHTEDGSYGQGEMFDKDFTMEEEQSNLESGLLEVVPVEYKVLGEEKVYGTNPGGVFTAAFTMGQEQHLVTSGHVERVDPEPLPPPTSIVAKRKKAVK